MLVKGAIFTKCPTSIGQLKQRIVRYTEETQSFTWHGEGKAPKPEAYFAIEDIVQINLGQNTKAFREFGDPRLAKLSFSICGTERTLDLSCANEKILKEWVGAIEALLIFVPHSTPQERAKEKKKSDKIEQHVREVVKKKEARTQLQKNMKSKYGIK